MKNAALILAFAAVGIAANAQRFTLLPQAGFESSRTSLSFSNLATFSPLNMNFTPQASLRLDYKFKTGAGPYLNISTARSRVNYRFTDAETVMTNYTAVAGNMQLRFEGGLQYSFKPLLLTKAKGAASKSRATNKETKSYPSAYKGNCARKYESYSSRCGNKKPPQMINRKRSNTPWISIQPSLGFAYVPSAEALLSSKTQGGQSTYEYRAGNSNAAIVAGSGFEFGKGNTRKFTITVSYFAGIGNWNEQSVTTVTGNKSSTTTIASNVSGWNVRVGIPFTLSKKKNEVKQKQEMRRHHEHKNRCGQYKLIYHYRKS